MRGFRLCLLLMFAVLGSSAKPAFAERDVVQFGSTIQVAPGASVHDAVCFFCNVDDQGTVEGNVVVFFGNVHLAQRADRDVVNFFGNVVADSNASVGNNMVSFFGNVRLGENVSVGRDLVAMFGGVHAAPTVSVGGNRVVQPAWIFWGPLVVFILVVILLVREFSAYRRRVYLRNYPFPPPPRP